MDAAGLVTALKVQVLSLEDDLRQRVDEQSEVSERWRSEHRRVVAAERTASSWTAWRDDRVTQAAVAWVLTSVFVRFCEDNQLVKPVWIAGPASRRQEALDAQLSYFRGEPEATDREWLMQALDYLKRLPATRSLVDDHSPLWSVSPSGQAVTGLLAFWRDRDEQGELRWDFTADDWSTRFLGDLYQDLSEHAKKTYALLQTPEFVEEFILDQTLEPALKERPLDGFSMIDPTCGSGHFLLGAFHCLLEKWKVQAPGMETQERVKRALDAVHGVDLNPFAVAIARFRLTVAALQACGLTSLEQAPGFTYQVATGDSLLVGRRVQDELPGLNEDEYLTQMTNSTEDLVLLQSILTAGRYDVVVGNPPYIPARDNKLNQAYRKRYSTCKGSYGLTVPFMERFFDLAKSSRGDLAAGWVGQITSNSFMKREFGSKLIEDFLIKQDLRLVADTSGAYIPGHGTPTVIITGRHQQPIGSTVRAVLGIRGEPGRPDRPEQGVVWRSIVDRVNEPDYQDPWITVRDAPRDSLSTHPWSLTGGSATWVSEALAKAPLILGSMIKEIGITIKSGTDDAYFLDADVLRVRHLGNDTVPVVLGEDVRDYAIQPHLLTIFPFDSNGRSAKLGPEAERWLWRSKRILETQLDFGETKSERKLRWVDPSMFFGSRFRSPLSLAFPFVATHNHFALDRGGRVFNRTAPAIKLPEGATEDDHLGLLGVLNSSTACFWLKQNSYPKGGDPVGDDGARVSQQPWSDRYEFTGTTLQGLSASRATAAVSCPGPGRPGSTMVRAAAGTGD